LADWFTVDIVTASGEVEQVVVAHKDSAKVELAHQLHLRYPPRLSTDRGIAKVLRTGKLEYIPRISQAALEDMAESSDHLKMMRAIGFSSVIILPLIARGRTFGTMTLVMTDPGRQFWASDLMLTSQLGERVAMAIDNARLYHEAQLELERREEVEAHLQQLTLTLEQRVIDRTFELQLTNRELGQEIIERETAEIGLRTQSAQLAQQARFLNLAHDAIFSRDLEGHITYWNRGAEDLYEWRIDEIAGKVAQEVLGASYPIPLPKIEAAVLSQGFWEGEINHRTKTGRQIVVMSRWSLTSDDEGNSVGILEINSDITQQRQSEEALSRLRQQQAMILRSAGEGIFGLDLAGRVTFINDSAANILGWPVEQIVGKVIHRLVHHHYPDGSPYPRKDCPINHVLLDGIERRERDDVFWRRDGTSIPVSYTSSPIKEDGAIVGAVVTFSDTTELHRAQEAMAAYARELERSNQDLQDFASVASHDLQEPLRKIQAFGDRLQRTYAPQLQAEGADYLERMLGAATRMRVLIDDLLKFSRVTTSAQPHMSVHLEKVCREVVSDLEAQVAHCRGRVEIGKLPTIEADALQMRQLLQNLISNGLKFHRPDIPPLVKVVSKEVTLEPNGNLAIELRVIDNGIGFDEKYLDRIFQVFQRLHAREKYQGTGVGLAVCRKIVERHGGTITAQSMPDQGAEFIVVLPKYKTNGGTP
jgi:PAS domain S-box-containing protein